MEYVGGSEWRRWDLHIHTPQTLKNDNYVGSTSDEKWDAFYTAVSNYVGDGSDRNRAIAAVGITDYLSIDNYLKVCADHRLPDTIKLILPNVEMRLTLTAQESPVNIHMIFDPCIVDALEARFFGKLSFKYGDTTFSATKSELIRFGKLMDNSSTNEQAEKIGAEQFLVDFHALQGLFENDKDLRKHTIIAVANSSTDGASGIGKRGGGSQTSALRKSLYHFVDAIFSSNQNDRDYFLGKKADSPETVAEYYGSLMPCIHGSDAHSCDKLFEPDSKRYCWIKADLTFEGLLQILYEPEERVAIQEDVPFEKDEHQIIHAIKFEDDNFQETPIIFNEALNCIIGGKSTGKSLLLEQLGYSIDSSYAEQQVKSRAFKRKPFPIKKATVTWKDGTSDRRKIVYIPQTYLNQTIDNPEESTAIDKIVEDVLLQDNALLGAHERLELAVAAIKKQVNSDIVEYVAVLNKINDIEEQIKEFGSPEMFLQTIKELEGERKVLAEKIDITQNEIDRYGVLESTIASLTSIKQQAADEFEQMKEMQSPKIVIPGWFSSEDGRSISHDFSGSFHTVCSELTESIKELEEGVQSEWIDKKNILVQIIQKKKDETSDQLTIATSEYAALKVKVDQSTQLQKLSGRITQEREKWQIADTRSKEHKKLLEHREELHHKIIESQSRYYEAYSTYCGAVKSIGTRDDTELVFEATAVWKQKDFQGGLSNVFDNRKYSAFRTIHSYDLAALNQSDYSDKLLEAIWTAMSETQVQGTLTLKSTNTMESALSFLFKDWYNIHYVVKSGNDTIEEMSPGKKALVLLELLINLEDSKCPILIDQPEDDLDNRSIYDDLVQFIKRKKKERQIIIVTHNANVVLGADAEEVIIANQDGKNTENAAKRFEYRSGSIENDETIMESDGTPKKGILYKKGIQTQICDILEGGRIAFELRRNKYRSS